MNRLSEPLAKAGEELVNWAGVQLTVELQARPYAPLA